MIIDVHLDDNINLMPETVVEEVIQNVRMLAGIWRGEVPLDRSIGIDPRLIDSPLGLVKTRLTADLTAALGKIEPRAVLRSVTFRVEPVSGQLEPIISISIEEDAS